MPTAKAYDLGKALSRTNDIEVMQTVGIPVAMVAPDRDTPGCRAAA